MRLSAKTGVIWTVIFCAPVFAIHSVTRTLYADDPLALEVTKFIRLEPKVNAQVGIVTEMHLIGLTLVQASDVDTASRQYMYNVVGSRGSTTVTVVVSPIGDGSARPSMSVRFVQ